MIDNPSSASVIVVHGAWADGSSWWKVIAALSRQGVTVVAAPIPLTSLRDDVDALTRVIDRVGGPVVLAAHAYAGAVIGACPHQDVAALIYVAALAPDENETVGDVFYRTEPHPQAPHLSPDGDGLIWLPSDAFASAFAPNATPDEHVLLAAVQRPISVQCLQQPVPLPRWKRLPSWYLIAEEDRMIDPVTQAFMAARMGAVVHTHRVDHSPLISRPDVVTDIIGMALDAHPDHALAPR